MEVSKILSRIVIVDDEKDAVDTLTTLFESEGIQVVGKGYDGKQAYELYKKEKPDVIILDMKMPEFSGLYAIEKIKAEFPDAKIIVITGYVEYNQIKLNCEKFFHKPYDFDVLLDAVKSVSLLKVHS